MFYGEERRYIPMHFGKLLTTVAAALLVSATFVMPVSAHHGHHRQAAKVDTSCPVCTVEGCTEEGHHLHDDAYYCSYAHEDGYCDGSCGYCDSSCGHFTRTYSRHGGGRGHHRHC